MKLQIYFCFTEPVLFRGSEWGADVLLWLTPHWDRVRSFVRQEEGALGNVRGGGLKVSQQSVYGKTKQRLHIT